MPSIQIQLMVGPAAGRKAVLDKSKLSFGRSPDCDIVIDDAHVSREHGHLIYHEGRWQVVNESPNGTTVNGKRIKQPRDLVSGDVLGVGRTRLFGIGLPKTEKPDDEPAPTSQPTGAAQRSEAEIQADIERRKRLRLWSMIGVYFIVVIVGGFVISQVLRDDRDGQAGRPEALSPEQIERDITRQVSVVTDERAARQRLTEARGLYRRRQQSPRTLYEAYEAFRQALALSGEDEFDDGLVQLEYKTAEEELIEQVTRHYYNTYALVGAGRYHDAERELRRLIQEIYPDDQSRLFAHANRLLRYVRRHTKD